MTMSVSKVTKALVRDQQMGMMHLRDDDDKGKLKYSTTKVARTGQEWNFALCTKRQALIATAIK
jgi:hypothetical protein